MADTSTNNNTQTQLPLSQQLLQEAAQKSYTKQLQAHADNTPHQILGQLIDNWAAQGGTAVPNNVPVGSSPTITADAAQSIVGGPTQNQGNFFGGGSADPNAGASGSFKVPTGQTQTQAQPTQSKKAAPQATPTTTPPPEPIQATPEADQTAENYKQANLLLSQQALKEAQTKNWLQRFNDNFTKMSGGVTQADRLANISAGQKIAGGEQLQPKDIATLNSDQWRAGLDATKTSLTAEAQNMSNLVDLHSKLENTKGVWNKTWGIASKDQKAVVGRINESYKNVGNLINNIKTFTDNAPQFTGSGVVNSKAASVANKVQSSVDPAAIAEARKRGLIK